MFTLNTSLKTLPPDVTNHQGDKDEQPVQRMQVGYTDIPSVYSLQDKQILLKDVHLRIMVPATVLEVDAQQRVLTVLVRDIDVVNMPLQRAKSGQAFNNYKFSALGWIATVLSLISAAVVISIPTLLPLFVLQNIPHNSAGLAAFWSGHQPGNLMYNRLVLWLLVLLPIMAAGLMWAHIRRFGGVVMGWIGAITSSLTAGCSLALITFVLVLQDWFPLDLVDRYVYTESSHALSLLRGDVFSDAMMVASIGYGCVVGMILLLACASRKVRL